MSPERRALLRFLAASPVAAALGPWADAIADEHAARLAADALDVFELEAAAQRLVPPAHWGYLQSGVDGDVTLHANAAAYGRYQLKPRRLVDVSHVDLAIEVFGIKAASPIGCWPIGSLRALHPEGDIAVARATRNRNALHIMSTQASFPVEEINEVRGTPVWYQLYTTEPVRGHPQSWSSGPRRPAARWWRSRWTHRPVAIPRAHRDCAATTPAPAATATRWTITAIPGPLISTKPMFGGIDTQNLGLTQPSLTWDFVKRLKDVTKMKVLLKGIESGEDAALAVSNGADGIIVSNHGGRSIESGRGTLESLPDVVQAVAGRIPVLVDGGMRRGTDAFKALALGASAVGIGRPYAWGLAAFGQDGVERVLDILNLELRLAMVGCGARTVREISAATLIDIGRPR